MNEDSDTERSKSARDELAALTADLIRFPTVNPPGEAYLALRRIHRRAAEQARLRDRISSAPKARRATPTAIRAAMSSPAAKAARPDRRSISIPTSTSSRPARTGRSIPFAGIVARRPRLRPRRLRHEGRARGLDHRRRSLHRGLSRTFPARSRFPARPTRNPAASAASRYLAKHGYFSKPRVDHVIIPEPLNKDRICLGHRGVWWAEIETKGEIAHGSMPFLGDCAVRHMGAVLEAFERRPVSGARPQADDACRSCPKARGARR